MISFNSVPSNVRVPAFYAEFDASRAQQGDSILSYRALLIGQRLTSGTAQANTLVKVTNADDVLTLAGRGSMLHRMAKKWFAANKSTELWIGVLDDNGAGTAATKTITCTGPATAAGTLHLYVAGDYIPVAITSGMAATDIAAAIAAALPSNSDYAATATAALAVATLAYRHKGDIGNDLDVRINYQDGQALPAGVGVTIASGTTGATNPVLTSLIAALGDTWFQVIAEPYVDATSLTALEAELNSRFGPMRQIDGLAFASDAGTEGTLASLGESRNNPHVSINAQPGKNPMQLPCEFAAGLAGVVAYYAAIDPARPFQTLSVPGMLPPATTDLFTMQERDLLLHDGIGTSIAMPDGTVQIERPITTYQTNAAGAPDTAYLDVTTMLTLMYLRWDFRTLWPREYPRHKLAADGTRIGAGQAVITPKLAKARAIAWARAKEQQGLLQNVDDFKASLVVEINSSDPNRLDFLLPPELMGQFIVGAANIQFRL